MIVLRHGGLRPFTRGWKLDRRYFTGEEALPFRDSIALLGTQRELVCILQLDLEIARALVRSLRHLIVAKLLGQLGIGKAGTDRAVIELDVPSEGGLGPAHSEPRAAYALDSAAEEHIA